MKRTRYQKQRWFLNEDEHTNDDVFLADLYVVCPLINVSIKLETCYGYGLKYKDFAAAREAAIKEAQLIIKKYYRGEFDSKSFLRSIVGQALLPHPLVEV